MSNILPNMVYVGLERWRGDSYNTWSYSPDDEVNESYFKAADYKWSVVHFDDEGRCDFETVQQALGLAVDESVGCTYEIAIRKL